MHSIDLCKTLTPAIASPFVKLLLYYPKFLFLHQTLMIPLEFGGPLYSSEMGVACTKFCFHCFVFSKIVGF